VITISEIENRIASVFPILGNGQAGLSEHLENYSFSKNGSFNEQGIAQRRHWFVEQSGMVRKLLASMFPNRAPYEHLAISHLFLGPVEQEIIELENRDRCYCYIVEKLHKVQN
jgi:hypothetical protein